MLITLGLVGSFKSLIPCRRPAEVQARSMNTVRAVRRALSVSRRGADGHDPSTSRRSSGSVHAPPPDVAQLSEESRAEVRADCDRAGKSSCTSLGSQTDRPGCYPDPDPDPGVDPDPLLTLQFDIKFDSHSLTLSLSLSLPSVLHMAGAAGVVPWQRGRPAPRQPRRPRARSASRR